jgi:hypothetical protein
MLFPFEEFAEAMATRAAIAIMTDLCIVFVVLLNLYYIFCERLL